jgi:hypothetical protein
MTTPTPDSVETVEAVRRLCGLLDPETMVDPENWTTG